MAELKPCPFCGSERTYIGKCSAPHILKKYHSGYFAGCLDCKITTRIHNPRKTRSPLLNDVEEERARQRAIDDWNTRAKESERE